MADGSPKAIDQVQPGDRVFSRDPETGKDEAREVTATYAHPADALVTVTLADPAMGRVVDALTCTPEHPLFAAGAGWVEAGSLGVGTQIVTRDGQALSVTAIKWQRAKDGEAFTVYNLTVAGDHTYFAGQDHGGVWTHNECPGLSAAKKLLGRWARSPKTSKPASGTRADSVRYHFDQHGDEVGAEDEWDYMRQASKASQNLKGTGQPVDGPTPNTMRYKLSGGRYIDVSPSGIVSYGAR